MSSSFRADIGRISSPKKVSLWKNTVTFTEQPPAALVETTGGVWTLNVASAVVPAAVLYNPWLAYAQSGGISFLFKTESQHINDGVAATINLGTIYDYHAGVNITAYIKTDVTAIKHVSFFASPTYGVLSAGVGVIDEDIGFLSVPITGAGFTITDRVGFRAGDAFGSATITNNYGVDIAALTKGSALNIGLRNASRTVFTPSTQNLTAVTNAITPTATVHEVTLNAAYTLTSTPHIADGANGQLLVLINADSADSLTLRDQSAIASNLRLPFAVSLVLGPRDTATFIFSVALGDWICVGSTNN